MNQISFTARPIHKIPVKKLVGNDYKDVIANFVELEQASESDNKALQKTVNMWDQCISYSLYSNFDRKEPKLNTQFYALTLQDKDFENPVADKILGLMEVAYPPDKKESFINFSQTNPKYIHDIPLYPEVAKFFQKLFNIKPEPPTEYTNIGTAMIQSLEKMKPENCIRLQPLDSVVPFYQKLGFHFESTLLGKYMRRDSSKGGNS